MWFSFKLAHRLARTWGIFLTVTALATACGRDRAVVDPTTPPDTTPTPQPPPPPPPPPQPPPVVKHAGFFVAPNGSSANDGSEQRPWTLATALAGGNGTVSAGDTIWVRGGTYYAPFRSTVSGRSGAPVVIRAFPGERAIIDGVNASGDNFVVSGTYSVIWGLEFTSSGTSRYTSVINHDYRPDNIVNSGSHNKYINIVVHDGGVALYTYSQYGDVEIYGSIFYNNGWQAPDRGHGHALYLKNDNGPLIAKDNVIFNQYGYGIHVYTNTGDGLLNNIRLEGNVSFDNGSVATTGTSANLGNLGEPLANNLAVLNNMTYMAASLSGANVTLGSGSGLTATGNYVVGGGGLTQSAWSGALVSGNTILAAGPATRTAQVFVRPNAYESGRANVVVYNWSRQSSVAVNLGGVLNTGDRFEVRNVQDLWGAPVLTGTYGGSISIPMAGVNAPRPVGESTTRAPRTGPDFDVFVVTRLP